MKRMLQSLFCFLGFLFFLIVIGKPAEWQADVVTVFGGALLAVEQPYQQVAGAGLVLHGLEG